MAVATGLNGVDSSHNLGTHCSGVFCASHGPNSGISSTRSDRFLNDEILCDNLIMASICSWFRLLREPWPDELLELKTPSLPRRKNWNSESNILPIGDPFKLIRHNNIANVNLSLCNIPLATLS